MQATNNPTSPTTSSSSKADVSTCALCVWLGLIVSLLLVVLADLCVAAIRGRS